MRISIRGRKFEQGDQKVDEPIEISANYRLRGNNSKQLEAKRIGDLDIVFVNSPGRLKTRQLAYKTALKKRMELLFRRKISIDELPSTQITQQLRSLMLDSVEATRGWLALAFDLSNVDLKSQLGMSMGGSSTASAASSQPNAMLPSYYTRAVPTTPVKCNNCQPANNRRRRLFGRFRRR